MENKDVNTDYQRVVRLGDQKWQIVEITIKISFVCLFVYLGFVSTIFLFILFIYSCQRFNTLQKYDRLTIKINP